MKNPMRTFALLMVALFWVNACAHLTSNPANKETLKTSVEKVWDAKLNGDWGVVYDIAVKEYKKKMKKTTFLKRANVVVKEYDIKDIKILEPGKKAISVVGYKIVQAGFEFNISRFKEEWLWEEGAWHLNLLPTLNSPIIEQKSQQQ